MMDDADMKHVGVAAIDINIRPTQSKIAGFVLTFEIDEIATDNGVVVLLTATTDVHAEILYVVAPQRGEGLRRNDNRVVSIGNGVDGDGLALHTDNGIDNIVAYIHGKSVDTVAPIRCHTMNAMGIDTRFGDKRVVPLRWGAHGVNKRF